MESEQLSSKRQFHPTAQPDNPKIIPWLLLALLVGGIVTAAVIGAALLLMPATETKPVTLIVNDQPREVNSHADTVAHLLAEARVQLNQGDQVMPPLAAALEVGAVVRVDRAHSVLLTVDGDTAAPLWTPLTHPADILASAGVRVRAGDRLVIDGTDATPDELANWPVPVSQIDVRHTMTLTIHDETGTQTIQTTESTVGEALFDAGITLYLTDSTIPGLNTPITSGLDVTITRARPVQIIADGQTTHTRSRGSTVADALADAGITLTGQDYAIPAERTPLRPGMSIRVIRVREEIESQTQPLPFETVYQADANLELDHQQVTQAGAPGVQETHTRVRYENGIAIERSDPETVITQAPQNRIISYGTQVVIHAINTPDGPRDYWRVLRLYVTSYHEVGGDSTTATGQHLQKGIVGADPDLLPYGTLVYVPNYGIGNVQDTGPKRKTPMWLDLGYSLDDYKGWYGYHDVYILTPVPDHIDYVLPGN